MELGQPFINFTFINTQDPKYLMLGDLSEYLFIEGKPAIVQITLPGYTEPLEFTWHKKHTNVFNSNNLRITCLNNCGKQDYADLPDGIYKAKVIASPDKFNKERYYLKTDQFELELSKIRLDKFLKDGFTEVLKKWSSDVEILITAAKDAIRDGKIETAKRFFDEAKSILNKYKECK